MTDTVVRQPWIPAGGVHLVVDGAGVDVFVLSSQDAVSEATATRKSGPPSVQAPGNVEVWPPVLQLPERSSVLSEKFLLLTLTDGSLDSFDLV